MKALIGTGVAALALLLSGCGDGKDAAAGSATASGPVQLDPIPAPNGADWTEVVSQTEAGGFLMGNPDAPVKVVEYASTTCPHCARFAENGFEQLRDQYVRSGQVSFEFRNFVLNPQDAAAATLSRCLPPPAFFRVTEQLFAEQQNWIGALDEAEAARIQSLPQDRQLAALARAMDLDTFFSRRGMPEARFNQCLADQEGLQRLAEMNQEAISQYRIQGTPSFLVNDSLAEGASDWETLEPRIRTALGS